MIIIPTLKERVHIALNIHNCSHSIIFLASEFHTNILFIYVNLVNYLEHSAQNMSQLEYANTPVRETIIQGSKIYSIIIVICFMQLVTIREPTFTNKRPYMPRKAGTFQLSLNQFPNRKAREKERGMEGRREEGRKCSYCYMEIHAINQIPKLIAQMNSWFYKSSNFLTAMRDNTK